MLANEARVDWELSESDPPAEAVERITFVPFLPDGQCGLIRDESGRLVLPSGVVLAGEHWLLDSSLRIPLMTAGFRTQRVHPFAVWGTSLFVWTEGNQYTGNRPHAHVALVTDGPDVIVEQLRAAAQPATAELVSAAARSYRALDEAAYFADNLRLLEPAYLRATTVEGGSGFGSGPDDWRMAREPMVEGITHDGSFLDAGCANGLLMEPQLVVCATPQVDPLKIGVIEVKVGGQSLRRRRTNVMTVRLFPISAEESDRHRRRGLPPSISWLKTPPRGQLLPPPLDQNSLAQDPAPLLLRGRLGARRSRRSKPTASGRRRG